MSGDCFAKAVEVARRLDDGKSEVSIVHGIPLGRGPIEGLRYWHAWVEVIDTLEFPDGTTVRSAMVIDESNGLKVTMPPGLYYRMGEIEDAWRWSLDAAAEEMLHCGHYGPWVEGWEEMTDVH